MKLYVVRHGETEFNAKGVLRGWMDPPLNAAGLAHAAELKAKLPQLPVYTSDLLRAVQTAQRISDYFEAERALRPWNVGIFQGCNGDVAHRRLTEYVKTPNVAVPFGEPFIVFLGRFLDFVAQLPCDSILVTHYRNCKVLTSMTTGTFSYEEFLKPGETATAEVLEVEWIS